MLHQREDYNRIQDAENKIGENEPVFLLRARDTYAPDAIRKLAELYMKAGLKFISERTFDWANKMENWQILNGCKNPDL